MALVLQFCIKVQNTAVEEREAPDLRSIDGQDADKSEHPFMASELYRTPIEL